MQRKDIIKFLRDNSEKLENYGVKRIGLFGSYKKDKQNKKSDIDIIVKFNQGDKTFDNYMDLKFYLEDKFSKNVDLVIEEDIKEELRSEIMDSVEYA